MPRGDALARQLQLIDILERKRALNVREAAEELGFSARTLYRDLEVLERVGVPIYQDTSSNRARWRVVEGYRHRMSLTLSWVEMLALAAGAELLTGLEGTFFLAGARSALDKARAALPRPLAARARALLRHLSATTGVRHDYGEHGEGLELLVRAIEARETVVLEYRKPGARSYQERRLDPYHVHVQAGAIYLAGWCHTRQAMRIFLLDRARDLRRVGERFARREAFVPEAFFHGAFGPWSGRSAKVRLRFGPDVAQAVAEQRLHTSQTTQWRAGGQLDVCLVVPVSPALVAWVTGWGAQVQVVAPKALRERVAGEHRAALEKASDL